MPSALYQPQPIRLLACSPLACAFQSHIGGGFFRCTAPAGERRDRPSIWALNLLLRLNLRRSLQGSGEPESARLDARRRTEWRLVQRGSAARPGGDQPLRALESCALVTALDVREARVGCWGGHAAAEAVKDSTAVWGSRRADGERESGRKERERGREGASEREKLGSATSLSQR